MTESEEGGEDLYLSAEEEEEEKESLWDEKKCRVGKSLRELKREKLFREEAEIHKIAHRIESYKPKE
eukprot:5623240-Karenia_brevis.AAC.1